MEGNRLCYNYVAKLDLSSKTQPQLPINPNKLVGSNFKMKLCVLYYHGLCMQFGCKKQVYQSIPSLIPIPCIKLVNKRS